MALVFLAIDKCLVCHEMVVFILATDIVILISSFLVICLSIYTLWEIPSM